MKSGMLAAEAAFEAIQAGRQHDELKAYPEAFRESWLYQELYKDRNFKTWFKKGLLIGTAMNGMEQSQFALRGHIPWTLHRHEPDHVQLKPAAECQPIDYPKPEDKTQVGIEIHSGKNRIVRRIFETLGYRVVKLDRVQFAGLTKKHLRRGDWRFLTEKEVDILRMGAFE